MTTLNKKALVFLLRERLGKDAVQDPTDIESNKNDYLIKKDLLLTLFKGDLISKVSKSWNNMVYLNEFIDFLKYEAIKLNNSKNTQGTYHIYMDYIHALYNIKCDNFNDKDKDQMGLPNYNKIKKDDKELYNSIYPKRKEFLFAWWTMNIIRRKYSKHINIEVGFQTRINKKIFDIYIKPCDLIIEYQEAKSNHSNNSNDKDKKAMIRGQGMVIEYFQESMYKENPDEYLHYFWTNHLEKRIIQNLIKNRKNNNFLDTYVFDKFLEIYQNKKKELEKLEDDEDSYITDRIYQLDLILNESQINIKKIFSWKYASRNKSDDMIISVNEIAELLNLTSKDDKKYISDTLKKLVLAQTKTSKIYTNWNGLITLLLMLDTSIIIIDEVLKRTIIDYLLSIQTIYEDVMDELDSFQNTLIANIIDNSQRREELIKKTSDDMYEKKISSLTATKADQAKTIKDFVKQSDKIMKTTSTFIPIIDDIKSELDNIKDKSNKTAISKIQKKLDKHKDHIDNSFNKINIFKPKQPYTLIENYSINGPILHNIPEIIYTGNIKNRINIIDIKSFFIRRKIPIDTIELLIGALSPHSNKPKVLAKLKLIDEFIKDSDDENSDYENSDKENDSDIENHSDIENDSNTDEEIINNNDDSNNENSDDEEDDENSNNEDSEYEDNNKNIKNNNESNKDNNSDSDSDLSDHDRADIY